MKFKPYNYTRYTGYNNISNYRKRRYYKVDSNRIISMIIMGGLIILVQILIKALPYMIIGLYMVMFESLKLSYGVLNKSFRLSVYTYEKLIKTINHEIINKLVHIRNMYKNKKYTNNNIKISSLILVIYTLKFKKRI
jgi:hypothetical protein